MSPTARRARRARPRTDGTTRRRTTLGALGLAIAGALLPGTAYLVAGRRRLGTLVLVTWLGLLGSAAYVGLVRREDLISWALDPDVLLGMILGLIGLGLAWVTVLVTSYKLLRPVPSGIGPRLFGSAVIGLVCFAIAAGSAVGTQNLVAQRNLVTKVFADGDSKSGTKPQLDRKDPWADLPRLNLLLLGADDAEGRPGTRTDTVIVASIDTRTGDTALISLTRNFMRMPFPKGTPLHDKFPTGFWNPAVPADKEQSEFYLDAMYKNVPRDYGNLLEPSDNPGADVLKLSVGEALGLKLHYYLQINLSGFEKMVAALGGITVNINYPVPVGGDDDKNIPPGRYLQPGPNRKLQGFDALWFARGRYRVPGADLARQARQRCTIKAIVERATPQNVLTNYQEIAAAGEQLIRTDVPQEQLANFVALGQKVKSAKIKNVDLDKKKNFPNGRNPNYAGMRAIVKTALNPPTAVKPTVQPTLRPTPTEEPADLTASCAYNPS
ncbi:LytR family transcriptional attenuator [Kribbella amoyensis]|uniref:LytR family transcriptional attenuator n=1 Tax=Kribbella amoyensis TaxID=996641 RepID=A0A561BNK6_9ACTN|nr:LCP family protein [Kribbella amoyensis]TWD80460.1 LytR family transcriptional attenuator [Kribbella amoyensis]